MFLILKNKKVVYLYNFLVHTQTPTHTFSIYTHTSYTFSYMYITCISAAGFCCVTDTVFMNINHCFAFILLLRSHRVHLPRKN